MNTKDRNAQLVSISTTAEWDVIIIGGGATGLGCAVDAASRGLKTLLLEQSDFAKGTSSRSTKLVHGGVRYLAAGDVQLVYEALRERGLMLQNAPHLVKKQAFVIPCYSSFEKIKYVVGLKLYDWLAGKFSFGPSIILSKNKAKLALKGVNSDRLKGGVEYLDGQFDDARLALNLAQTAIEQGATVLNYVSVCDLEKTDGLLSGVVAQDNETGKKYSLKAKAVINATGVFVDNILDMDKPGSKPLVKPSQGVHIVLDRSFMPSESALMIPETSDGRVLFAVPWHNHLVVGTTDTPIDSHNLEPIALQEEVDFILQTAGEYLDRKPQKEDVLSVFAGLRPLAAPTKETGKTKEISRSHKIILSKTGLITITGGKWTTYRKMAEDSINQVLKQTNLGFRKCVTKNLAIHGSTHVKNADHFDYYGSDATRLKEMLNENPAFQILLHPKFPYLTGEVVWAVKNEMARTIEDILARRLRVLFLDAQAALDMAPVVANLIQTELGLSEDMKNKQLQNFNTLASRYLLETNK
ncbi:glycerol-3-phosphate dehydrogenase/oxidase [Pedobacter arcticus]|uniref:glycerol-3-phosphate dehydrogenase/oxidase n=1 Tax=Pedobacter arcticus TaxID=752140 RepID=UPI0002E434D5|nr:glycerol-3-phosphate dehydrogenase/oxidase [Pedobacter arcticus]